MSDDGKSDFDRELEILGNLSAAVRNALDRLEQNREAQEERIAASVRKMHWFRRAAVLAVVAAVFSLWTAHEANRAVHKASRAVIELAKVRCEAANEGNYKQKVLWDKIFIETKPASTPSDQALRDEFATFINKTFTQSKC